MMRCLLHLLAGVVLALASPLWLPLVLRPGEPVIATPTPNPTATPSATPEWASAEGVLVRVQASICQAGETHVLLESGVFLFSRSVSLYAYEGRYVRVWGWQAPSPECEVMDVMEIAVMGGALGPGG